MPPVETERRRTWGQAGCRDGDERGAGVAPVETIKRQTRGRAGRPGGDEQEAGLAMANGGMPLSGGWLPSLLHCDSWMSASQMSALEQSIRKFTEEPTKSGETRTWFEFQLVG